MSSEALKKVLLPGLLVTLVSGGLLYYWYFMRPTFEGTTSRVLQFTPENADFAKARRELESLLRQDLTADQEAFVKTMLGDTLSGVNRKEGTEYLKSVAQNNQYPANLRTRALTYLAEHAELDFRDANFLRETTFTGPIFENFIKDAFGNDWLALRKLNGWSNEIFPNVIANYRIALWYATEIEVNETNRSLMQQYLDAGDQILEKYKTLMTSNRKGIAYQTKARALALSGNKQTAEEYFLLAKREYASEPVTVFQAFHNIHNNVFYASFLAKHYGDSRINDIETVIESISEYIKNPQGGSLAIRAMLKAARDSNNPVYPLHDFNNDDWKRLEAFKSFNKLPQYLN